MSTDAHRRLIDLFIQQAAFDAKWIIVFIVEMDGLLLMPPYQMRWA